MPDYDYITVFFASLGAGYLGFIMILKLLPSRLTASHQSEKEEVVKEAKKQADAIRQEAVEANQSKMQIFREELEATLRDREENMKLSEQDLDLLENQFQPISARIQKLESETTQCEQHMQFAKTTWDETRQRIDAFDSQLRTELETRSRSDSQAILKSMTDNIVEQRQLESQKLLKLKTEELSNSAKRIASRFLGRSMARYAPEFPWPKMVNSVEVEDKKLWDIFATDQQQLLAVLKEKAGIEAEFMPARHSEMPAIIKLSGGMGVDREACRLALVELVKHGTSSWPKALDFYAKQRQILELQAIKMGQHAVTELQLNGIHPEVQKLIGYLNWRTSYRQNQYLHSFEVGLLAGLVASELKVDPQDAKRCGILHDIGKVLDYRIEGSHAVISGDYADRFGESQMICDTLMSHHNDLIVETPLAYVLKTADTLSGARPGARVNLEEGYQDRLSAIDDVIRGFPGITKSAIMNGAREIHIEVNHRKIRDEDLEGLTAAIAKKIESDVAFPGQIKVLVSRRFESSSVA